MIRYEIVQARTDHPIPANAVTFYFEITILKGPQQWYGPLPFDSLAAKAEYSIIGIGFCGDSFPIAKMPGWRTDSWGYHRDGVLLTPSLLPTAHVI